MSIIIAILIFGIIVLVHEYGHFIVARKNGIVVEEFAIGMGPLIYGKQKGATFYSLRLLPIGGYCKMLGVEESDNREGSFNAKGVFARIAVISAGSIMNFALSFVLVLIMISINGFASTYINTVTEGSPAQAIGLEQGDRVISIDNSRIRVFQDAHFALINNHQTPIDITIERNGQIMELVVTPIQMGASYIIGFSPARYAGLFGGLAPGEIRAGLGHTLATSFWTMINYMRLIIFSVGQLVTFNVALDDMAGMVGIVDIIDTTYRATIQINLWFMITQMLNLAALLSANLGVINLLPFPALDGGRLIFLGLEAIRGKPINPEKESMVHVVGFVLLIGLILIITYNDISRLVMR